MANILPKIALMTIKYFARLLSQTSICSDKHQYALTNIKMMSTDELPLTLIDQYNEDVNVE